MTEQPKNTSATPPVGPIAIANRMASPQFGAILPADMRVRLVRSDDNFDSILSLLYSSMLTVFGIFLGSILTKGAATTKLEYAATIAFGVFSILLLLWWVYCRIKCRETGITITQAQMDEAVSRNAQQS
jgi:hypothetical protein